jgi:small multidrug resistance pump
MIKTYLFLAGAVFFEVAGTMLLPVTQNFTKLVPTAALAFFYLCAFYLLTFVTDKIPIAIMYATWSGLEYLLLQFLAMYFLNKR